MKMKILAGTVIAAFTLSLGVISVFATESIINTPNNNVYIIIVVRAVSLLMKMAMEYVIIMVLVVAMA